MGLYAVAERADPLRWHRSRSNGADTRKQGHLIVGGDRLVLIQRADRRFTISMVSKDLQRVFDVYKVTGISLVPLILGSASKRR
jgi:hypothetical protein